MNTSWPLDSNLIRNRVVNNTFGMVRRRSDGSVKPHQGWDFVAAVGTPTYAVADGVVAYTSGVGDYGLQLCLRFEIDGVVRWAFYAHLEQFAVRTGTHVSVGTVIGTTGRSGNASTLPHSEDHLHFELRTRERPGRGLDGRVSPRELLGICPLTTPVLRT